MALPDTPAPGRQVSILPAALYLRVSTARQAEHDVSIPDQKRQGEAYCASRGYQLVETYVEPGASATNDCRPDFQRPISSARFPADDRGGHVEAHAVRGAHLRRNRAAAYPP
jgi:hypothetical protein